MSTYDFEPNPDDYGPEPAHIANPSKFDKLASQMSDCPYCGKPSKLVGGNVIYPHRPDLAGKWFWHCSPCDAYVGCHPTTTGKKPLGRLANAELRAAKMKAHAAIDPYWREGRLSRHAVYANLAVLMNLQKREAHIGMFDVEQCRKAIQLGTNALLWD